MTTLPTGVVTFLLTDVVGSTELWEHSPEDMAEALARHDEIVADAVEEAGGVLLKMRGEGDSTFSVFDRASAGVRAAYVLQRALQGESWPPGATIRTRAAVHTGEAIEREGDYFGPAVNLVARLRSATGGGQILVSAATATIVRRSLPAGCDLVEVGPLTLRGLADRVTAWEVIGPDLESALRVEPTRGSIPDDGATLSRPAAPPRSGPPERQSTANTLVGREREMEAIDRFMDAPAPAFALIAGEPGVGKTALWHACVTLARDRGVRVLTARPVEAEHALSFAVLSDLLDGYHHELGQLPAQHRRPLAAALLLEDPSAVPVEPRAIAMGLLMLLRGMARTEPLLLAVDDAQWLDPSSALALSFALRRTADAPIRALAAERTGPTIQRHIDVFAGLEVERIDVGAMEVGAFRRLVQMRLPVSLPHSLLRRVHERAEGNPFYGLELARALQHRSEPIPPDHDLPVPSDLRRLLQERLRALPPNLIEPLATVAALAEPTLELIGEDTVRPALDAGVLVLDGERIRFEHPLLAAAAYSRLTAARRRALHRRLARVVTSPEERARHLAAATDEADEELAVSLDEAAKLARARGAPAAAAELALHALRLTGQDESARVRRCVAAAEHHAVAGNLDEAQALVEDQLARVTDGANRARLLVQRARVGDQPVDAAITLMEEALANADGDVALEAEILAGLAHLMTSARRASDAEQYAERCLVLAEQAGDPPLLVRALDVLATNRFWLGRGLPVDLMERALALEPRCGSMRASSRPSGVFGWMCIFAGDLDRSRSLLDRARQLSEAGSDTSVHVVLWAAGELEFFADDWPRSLELAREIHQLGVDIDHGPARIVGLCAHAVLYAHLGDEDATRTYAAEAFALDERYGSRTAIRLGSWALALLELSLDDPAGALSHARPATVELRDEGLREPALLPPFPVHAEAAIAAGEPAEAEELIEWAEQHATRLDRAWALACCARCRGLAAAARGHEGAAFEAFDRALVEHGRVQGRRFDLARTLLAHGETLRRFKKKREARSSIERAIHIFDELGARLWSDKAARELARISGRTTASGLTETEHAVAQLVALGKSNKEVAAALFVTVRTVESHLTNIYKKFGVRSRTELARRLATNPPQ